eukprot:TCALIF_06221-PA protein Name:"Protein of unknown function" AED:0.06 eAED:0.06 QI:51/1/0.66/1/0.5/0.33/3/0/111
MPNSRRMAHWHFILIILATWNRAQAVHNDPWFDVTDAEVLRMDRSDVSDEVPLPKFVGPFDYTWFWRDVSNRLDLLQAHMNTSLTFWDNLKTLLNGKKLMALPSGGVAGFT